MDFSAIIKEKLLSLISEIDQYHWLFTRNPEKDFSRIKKWSFGEIVVIPTASGERKGRPISLDWDKKGRPRVPNSTNFTKTQMITKGKF